MSTPAFSAHHETRRPRSSVTVSWDEDPRRLQFEVSECIETKTVTTTTTTKRTFPPVFVREPRPLQSLDAKDYPLARGPTPPEIANFTFDLHGEELDQDLDSVKVEAEAEAEAGEIDSVSGTRGQDYSNLFAPPTDSKKSPSYSRPANSPTDVYSNRFRVATSREQLSQLSARRPIRSTSQHNNSPFIRRQAVRPSRQSNLTNQVSLTPGYISTPDASEVASGGAETPRRLRPLHLETRQTPESRPSHHPATNYDGASPVASDFHAGFSGSVATPPVDADIELFVAADEAHTQAEPMLGRPRAQSHSQQAAPVVVTTQDASLPSPRLSPKLAVAQLPAGGRMTEEDVDAQFASPGALPGDASLPWLEDSQMIGESDSLGLIRTPGCDGELDLGRNSGITPQSMLETFDSMPNQMKTFLMYQFLRRCTRETLRVVADAVNPALKCDFFKQLPLEVSYQVLSYLEFDDFCRCAQVSKHWRNIVDSNETGWKRLFDRDGHVLVPGELEKAIAQGWGWQDPEGPYGQELDLSSQAKSAEGEGDTVQGKTEQTTRLRSGKRKRGLNIGGAADRVKRRASSSQQQSARDDNGATSQPHRTEGPISAANAAVMAIPDPGDLPNKSPSLRKMHLYKSLYRRHHMIRQNWTSTKVKPGHIAFAAHPRHVITCLQFDEDKIVTGSDDTLIQVYDTKTGELRKKLEGHEGGVWALQYEGNMLVSGSTDRSVRVWDIEKGLCTQVFFGHTSTVRCLQILLPTEISKDFNGRPVMMPPRPLIITGSRDHHLRVWRLPEVGSRRYIQTGPPANDNDCPFFVRSLVGHGNSVRAISAHGDTLVSGSYDATVRVWRISTGECVHKLEGHGQKVYSVILDHKRNRCVSGSMDSLVKIWDLTTGANLYNLEGHNLLVGLLDLKDDRLVSAAADGTLRIWDPENGRCRNALMAHTGAITCFQHDSTKVISGSEKTLKMWDINTGELLRDLLTDLSGVWQVKFNHRRCVAAVQRDGITYIEILDFGAARDGVPVSELGVRKVINEDEAQRIRQEVRP